MNSCGNSHYSQFFRTVTNLKLLIRHRGGETFIESYKTSQIRLGKLNEFIRTMFVFGYLCHRYFAKPCKSVEQ